MTERQTTSAADRRACLARRRALCREQGLELTAAREVILETVLDLGTHPSADEVYEEATRRQPSIGRATVYRTLERFAQAGVITKACHPGVAVRYDFDIDRHHHLVCLRCDGIIDISDSRLDAVPVPDTHALGFVVTDLQVQLRGICRDCQAKEEKP